MQLSRKNPKNFFILPIGNFPNKPRKKIKKVLDKSQTMCYNDYSEREIKAL